MVGGTSGGRTRHVPTCSHSIAYSLPAVVAGMWGGCGAVNVASSPVLAAARPWKLSMRFLTSSD